MNPRGAALTIAAALISGCTFRHEVSLSPSYQVPAAKSAPVPLRVGVLVPDAASLPKSVTSRRCGFGKDVQTIFYEEAYGRIAFQAAEQRFQTAEPVADAAEAAGRYDALLEFTPPQVSAGSFCALPVTFWMVFPFFYPTIDWQYHVEAGVRLLDASDQRVVAESSAKDRFYTAGGVYDTIKAALDSLTSSPKFAHYTRSAKRARLDGLESQGDGAARQGRAPHAAARYLDAYRAAPPDDPAKDRLFKKLVDAARLGSLPIPPEAQRRADRGEAFIKLAKDARGFAKAAREFERAAASAPWWAEAHFNLGLAREKAGDPRGAAASLKLFLLAAPDAPEAAAVRQRLIELEVAGELAPGAEDVEGPVEEAAAAEEPAQSERPAKRKRKF